MSRGRRVSISPRLLAVLLAASGCAGAGAGTGVAPDPSAVVAALFDPAPLYRRMGFLASGAPLPFVGDLRFFGSTSPDTTLAVLALSLANNALAFRVADQEFEASYTVDLTLRRGRNIAARLRSPEHVRVASREESQRLDESVVFQKFLAVPPGEYEAVVTVRDEQAGVTARVEQSVRVPRIRRPGLSSVVALYPGSGRSTLGESPAILLNPRATIPFGLDSLWVYVEAYGLPGAGTAHVVVLGPGGGVVARQDALLPGNGPVASAVVGYGPDELPVGELRVQVTADRLADTVSLPVLVSFSNEWAITDFDEVLSLLRFFGRDSAVAEMRAADSAKRPVLWREFWRASDPNPASPGNEALEQYFRRIEEANQRFHEVGVAGWTTDRGEVFITLGVPDEVFDSNSDLQGPVRIIRWNYLQERVSLDFIDDTGFGRFRLTPASRGDYQRALNAIRSRD
jgi:GWxTD domain-containing protein